MRRLEAIRGKTNLHELLEADRGRLRQTEADRDRARRSEARDRTMQLEPRQARQNEIFSGRDGKKHESNDVNPTDSSKCKNDNIFLSSVTKRNYPKRTNEERRRK